MANSTSLVITDETRQRTLRVTGLVQGVGFRPTVWRLANRLGLSGNVRNDGRGVLIKCICDPDTLQLFVQALHDECPPLARINHIEEITDSDSGDLVDAHFEIIASSDTAISTGVIADAATCAACLVEMNDSTDRRHRYPFLNCTHCGPRFSIIQHIPYDRANTSMQLFSLCDNCESEYLDPADRRFHAQPTACAACGPRVWLCDKDGGAIICKDAIHEAARGITEGAIVAIKGIGGIHLACDANNHAAIHLLRQRKHRPDKPLALMAADIDQIRQHCKVNDIEQTALSSSAAPIVILDTLDTSRLPYNVAPGQKQLGFILPYSPLHHLLMRELKQLGASNPIVLTSGNRSDEPQCVDNNDALIRLNGIADYFLFHDRPIINRIDDSVVRDMNGKLQILRRARGYAPGHITLPAGFAKHPAALALGSELKNTFCLLKDGQAILSQHMGDLEDARTFDDYQKNISLYLELYAHKPELLVTDKHPEYLATKLGHEWSEKNDIPLMKIQHHHAHIAACMIDNNINLDEGPVIGVAFDGLGLGDDGTLWGGEFLLTDYRNHKRLAHLQPVVLPGASQAMREPWRNTWAQLCANYGWDTFTQNYETLDLCKTLKQKPVKTLQQMMNKNINSPLCSSAGRLFDAVSAALDLAPEQCSFEGQAAMALESCIDKQDLRQVSPYAFELIKHNNNYEINTSSMWPALLENLKAKTSSSIISARFHKGLAQSIINTANLLAKENNIDRIALSGGVFQNLSLLQLVVAGLEQKNLQVLTHNQVPANDGGIALGQAVIAAARSINNQQAYS